jgi:serine/threonine protein kinase
LLLRLAPLFIATNHFEDRMHCLNCHRNDLPETTKVCPHCRSSPSILVGEPLPSGTKLLDERYRIDYPVGRGGFGITYRAFDKQLKIEVVIKELFPREHATRKARSWDVAVPAAQRSAYKKALNQFLDEARILARIKNDHIVRVFNCFEQHHSAYIVMELVEGYTLRELLQQQPQKVFPLSEVELIVGQLVVALESIHLEGVYHLDLSPDNVLRTNGRKIVLIDFGAARHSLIASDPSIKMPGQLKPEYAAPEMQPKALVDRAAIGPWSDLFELGMLAYELSAGVPPPSVLQRLADGDQWRPRLPNLRWQTALQQALEIKPGLRARSVQHWWDLYRRRGIVLGRVRSNRIVIGKRK